MRFVFLLLMILPGFAFAAGSGSGGGTTWTNPPPTTKTTKTCKGVKVWDEKKNRCVRPKQSSLDPDGLMDAVRELAYAGRNEDAQGVLRAMPDQNDDLVLTYWGFTNRKLGKSDLARAYYARAITRNPDNILARSYLGQGLVAEGLVDEAIAQWREIKARGGEGTWAEASLREAIRTGLTFNY
jgi:tetratricopeptide (TPR) repeat protein